MPLMEKSQDSHSDLNHDENLRPRQTLGKLLKDARKSRGKSLEEISQASGIGLAMLEALENGERRGLPADVFVRGFIRIFAAQVGVDSQSALELYEQEWGGGSSDSPQTTRLLKGEAYATQSFVLRRWPALVSILVLCALAYLGAQFFFPALFVTHTQLGGEILGNDLPEIEIVSQTTTPFQEAESNVDQQSDDVSGTHATNIPTPTTESPVAIEPTEKTESPSADQDIVLIPSSEEGQETTESPIVDISEKVDHYTLHIEFTERTWVKIALDGQPPQEEIFRKGAKKTWEANTEIDLYLGNAGGVKITLNGEPMPIKEESGQTIRLKIP